jgi:Skp family chaperone for outer membrane proteins
LVSTILGAVFGKALGTGTLGRATTTMRDVGRSIDESGDVKRAEQTVEAAKQKVAELDTQLQAEIDALKAKMDPASEVLEKVLVRPRKSDITVDALGLVWMPHWKDASGSMTGAWV